MKLVFYISTLLLLFGCSEQKAKVYFVQLNDVYEIAPLGGGLYGGMARVAHVVDSLKAINPNTYLFMSGDFLNPSLLGNLKYNGERIKGRQMIEVMNAMGFTMATFGNHEFDLKYEEFQKDSTSRPLIGSTPIATTIRSRGLLPLKNGQILECQVVIQV